MDGQTDTCHHFIMPSPTEVGGHNNLNVIACNNLSCSTLQKHLSARYQSWSLMEMSCVREKQSRAIWLASSVSKRIYVYEYRSLTVSQIVAESSNSLGLRYFFVTFYRHKHHQLQILPLYLISTPEISYEINKISAL